MTMIRSRQPRISKLSRRSDMLYEIDRLDRKNKLKSEFDIRNQETIRDLRAKLIDLRNKYKSLLRKISDIELSKEDAVEKVRKLSEKYDDYVSMVDELMEEATQQEELLKVKNYQLNELLVKKHRECEMLQNQCKELSRSLELNDDLESLKKFIIGVDKLPRTIQDIILLAENIFGYALVFSEEAKRNYQNYTLDQIDDSWYLIKSLPILYDMLMVEKDPSFVQNFKDMTRLRFRLGETSYFKKDAGKMKDRLFTFEDGKFTCLWHIGKTPSNYGKAMRCYFYPDSSIGKIRVGYLGEHL